VSASIRVVFAAVPVGVVPGDGAVGSPGLASDPIAHSGYDGLRLALGDLGRQAGGALASPT
jgi:hypothetical protein